MPFNRSRLARLERNGQQRRRAPSCLEECTDSELLALVNKSRAQAGLPPLGLDCSVDDLETEARRAQSNKGS